MLAASETPAKALVAAKRETRAARVVGETAETAIRATHAPAALKKPPAAATGKAIALGTAKGTATLLQRRLRALFDEAPGAARGLLPQDWSDQRSNAVLSGGWLAAPWKD